MNRALVDLLSLMSRVLFGEVSLMVPWTRLPFEMTKLVVQTLVSFCISKRSPYRTKLSSPMSKTVILVFLSSYLVPSSSINPAWKNWFLRRLISKVTA